jgi:hypothetical protein
MISKLSKRFYIFEQEDRISKSIKMLLYLLKNQLLTRIDFKKCDTVRI